MLDPKKICKVCGLYYPEFYPWGENGEIPTHDICDCCGIEFGYEDSNEESVVTARNKWVENGSKWINDNKKPNNWDYQEQLKNLSV